MSRVISEAVVVEIRINRAGEAESSIDSLGAKSNATFSSMGSAVATVTKALLSMAAVIVVWTTFITIPEAIASALKKLAVVAIESADEMQRQIFNTAGLLASFAKFGPTVESSFNIATLAAEKLMVDFAALASQSVASATDIQLAFQTLVSRGGLSFTKDLSQAASLAGTLTNIVVALTGGLNKERQIVSEISALFEGQARTGAVMAKIIKAQVGDLDAWMTRMKAAGPGALEADLRRMFSGVIQGSAALGNTVGGMIASIQGNLEILNRIVQQSGGGFAVIVNWLRQWRDLLGDAVKDIGNIKGGFDSLKPATQTILYAMAEFSASIGIILDSLNRLLLSLLGAKTQLEAVQNFGYLLLRVTTILATLIDFIADKISSIGSFLQAILNPVGAVIEFLAKANAKYAEGKDEVQKQIQALSEVLKKLSDVHGWLALNNDQEKEATDAIKRKLIELQKELELAKANGNPFAQIWIRAKQAIADAVIEMKKFPGALAEAKHLIIETATINERNLLIDQKRTASLALERALNGDMAALLMEQAHTKEQISEAYAEDVDKMNQVAGAFKEIADKQIELLRHQQATQFQSEQNSLISQINQLNSGGDRAIAIQDQYIERLQQIYNQWHVGSEQLPSLINLLDKLTEAEEKALDRTRFFESIDSLVNSERILHDDIAETIRLMSLGTRSAMQLSGGYAAVRSALALLQDKLNDNAFAMAHLNAQKGLSIEQDRKVIEKQRELVLESNRIKTAISATVSAIRQMEDASVRMSDVIGNMIVRVRDLHQSLRAAFADELPNLLKAVGQSGAEAITSAIQGTEKLGAALKKALASEISAIGTRTIAQGIANLAQGIWPFNPVQLAAGAKQIAAGAAVVALANKLSPAAGPAAPSAGSSGGGQQSQTVLLTPFGYNPANSIVKTLDNLNATVDRLNTMAPGVVVAGAVNDPATAQILTKSVSRSLQGDQQTRAEMSKTLQGVT